MIKYDIELLSNGRLDKSTLSDCYNIGIAVIVYKVAGSGVGPVPPEKRKVYIR